MRCAGALGAGAHLGVLQERDQPARGAGPVGAEPEVTRARIVVVGALAHSASPRTSR